MKRHRTINVALIITMLLGLVAFTPTTSAQTEPSPSMSSDAMQSTTLAAPSVISVVQQRFVLRGFHEDVIARFSSGRTIKAHVAILHDTSTGQVLAWIEVFATGIRGNIVPGSYILKDFRLRGYICTGRDTCSLANTFIKCTGSGCAIRTTADKPVARFFGSVWRGKSGYGAWQTRGDSLSGVILNTSDSTSNKCVSSYRWQWYYDLYRAPSC